MSGLAPRIDLATLAEEDDPYPTYQRLRSAGPVVRAGANQWFVTRYAEVADLLQRRSLHQFQLAALLGQFPTSAPIHALLEDPAVRFTEKILAGRDGEDHRALRKCMARAMRTAVGSLDAIIETELDVLVGALRGRSEFDGVEEFAFPLPSRVLGRVVGIPASLRDECSRQSLTLAHVFTPDFGGAHRGAVNDAVVWLRECVSELLTRPSGAEPDEATFLRVFGSDALGRWDLAEVIDNVILVLFAGFETSMNLLAGGLDALLEFPDEQLRLRQSPDLLPSAIEEFLRFCSPVQITGRLTTEPMMIAGQRVGVGRVVYLGLASANRDPDAFMEPDRLDVGRGNNRHVALGHGAHHCLGAFVARREAHLAFERVTKKLGRLERASPKDRKRSATLRSIRRLAISLRS